jgi:hypothetical protein
LFNCTFRKLKGNGGFILFELPQGKLTMKKLLVLLSSLCIASTVFAEDVYVEEVRVFRTGELIAGNNIENGGGPVLDACYAGLAALEEGGGITGIAPTLGARVKLYPVQFEETDSTLLTENDDNSDGEKVYVPTGDVSIWQKPVTETEPVEAIGEILVCQDWQTYFNGAGVNLVPVYYEITVGDVTYTAAGGGQSPNFPNLPVLPGGGELLAAQIWDGSSWVAGFPTASVYMMAIRATIVPAAPVGEVPPWSPPGFGGTFTANTLWDNLGVEDQFRIGDIITIRTYTPAND